MTNKEHLEAIQNLARVFNDKSKAHQLLARIEFPAHHRPTFGKAYAFWQTVYPDVRNGMTKGREEALLREAAALFPHDEYFEPFSGEPANGTPASGHDPPAVANKHFSQDELHQILKLFTQLGLLKQDSFDTLFSTMDDAVIARLPAHGNPRARALQVLAALNKMPELANGELPFRAFLTNALVLSEELKDAEKLSIFLDRLE